MSDEEHHFESKADAGASKTYPQQAGTIRKNGYIVIKNRPCKVYLCFYFFFLVTDFYLVFCCFYQISCVFFLIWLSFFIKFNFKEVISSKFNVWMYWELIKSVWVCYKKVDFDFGVDGVPWDLLFSSWGFMYLKAFNFSSMSVWLCYVCLIILMVDLKVDVFMCYLCQDFRLGTIVFKA
jgi:hypothetical protein